MPLLVNEYKLFMLLLCCSFEIGSVHSIVKKSKFQFGGRIRESEVEFVALTDPVILVNWNFIFSFRTQTCTHTQTHVRKHSHTLIKRHIKKFICHDATATAVAMATLATLCSYHFNSPVPKPRPHSYPSHTSCWCCCWCCCCRLPLNGIFRLCVTHAGHYPFYRCLPFPLKFETLLWVKPPTPPPASS